MTKHVGIDCEELLFGNPTWDQVVAFFKGGSFDEESWFVAAIKKHLRTDAQRAWLSGADITIEDMLNGRVDTHAQPGVYSIFNDWNTKLGFKCFGA